MESMWANVVIIWSKRRKIAQIFVRFGPFGAVSRARRPPFGVVGYKPQLVAAFFIATSTLDPIQWYFGPEISPFFRGENCRKKVTQNLRAC